MTAACPTSVAYTGAFRPYSRGCMRMPTDEQLRSPLGIIPPDQRPRVALGYGAQNELLVSGLLTGGGDVAQRPAVVDSPMEKGHVVYCVKFVRNDCHAIRSLRRVGNQEEESSGFD